MKYSIFYIMLILIVLVVNIKPGKAFEPEDGKISEELREEMKVQELILERIIRHYDKERILVAHNVSTYYIHDYGVLFELQRFPRSEYNFFDRFGATNDVVGQKYEWSEEKKAIIKVETKHGKSDSIEVEKMVQKLLKGIHIGAFEFLADYMSQTTWLKENEKVCIHFDIKLNKKIPKEYDRRIIEKVVPIAWQASVKMSDLKKLRDEIISIEQLNDKIEIKKLYLDSKSYNYRILADVLNSAVRSTKQNGRNYFSLYTTSININDLGALFFLVTQYRSSSSDNFIKDFFEFLLKGEDPDEDSSNESSEDYDDLIKNLKFRLIKTIGQYGHKIKNIDDDQWIILVVNIGYRGRFKTRFVMKALKRDIDLLVSNEISFTEFMNSIQVFDEEFLN